MIILDEAQEALPSILTELRILASSELDSKQLMSVILAGDERLISKLQYPDLLPIDSRIRYKLKLGPRNKEEMKKILDTILEKAHGYEIMTEGVKLTLIEQSGGNLRALMNLSAQILSTAVDKNVQRIDETFYFQMNPNAVPKVRK